MKHRWTLFLLSAFFFVLLTSMKMPASPVGSNDLTVEVTATNDLRVQLTAQNETGEKLYLTVSMLERDVFGNNRQTEVYAEQILGDVVEIKRTLNLSNLDIGKYQIKIKAGKKRVTQLVDIRAKPEKTAADARIILLK